MRAKTLGRTLNQSDLHHHIRPLRQLHDSINIRYLLQDYLTLTVVLSLSIIFLHSRQSWGLSWVWNVPVLAVTMILVGALQHRLAGLAHEAAHFSFLKNRYWNDLISDLFCMFPLFATTHQYRLVHTAHHQYTNDWERDPDLMNIGKSKLMHAFPMNRWQFVFNYFLKFFYPPVLLRYLWDILYLSVFGKGLNPYKKEIETRDQANQFQFHFSIPGFLGLVYFFGLVVGMATLNAYEGGPVFAGSSLLGWFPAIALVVALVTLWSMPDTWFFQSPIKPPYSLKFSYTIRLLYYTVMLCSFAYLKKTTGFMWSNYYLLLWCLPMLTTFPYFMLLRDVYQHANADDGKLTNTRVFFTDAFSHWAIFVYGQDMHIPHHLYPAIPHYHLAELHHLLKAQNEEYRQYVVECHGTFANKVNQPTILDVMLQPTCEPIIKNSETGETPSNLAGTVIPSSREFNRETDRVQKNNAA